VPRKRAIVSSASQLRDRINQQMRSNVVMLGNAPGLEIEKVPTGSLMLDRLLLGGFARGRHSVLYGDFQCVAGNTKVLMADLTWRDASEVEQGDNLVSVQEHTSGRGVGRRLEVGVVEENARQMQSCVCVETDQDTSTVVSRDHRWLVRTKKGTRWVRTDKLAIGDEIIWFGAPWGDACDPYAAAYLEGLYDGEAWFDHRGSQYNRVVLSQVEGPTLDKAVRLLAELGFETLLAYANGQSKTKYQPCYAVTVGGGLTEVMRFMAQVHPQRLLMKDPFFWVGRNYLPKGRFVKRPSVARVTKISRSHRAETFSLTNSSHTFIGDGLICHNSAKSLTLYRTLALTQQRGEIAALIDAEHVYNPAWFAKVGGDPDSLVLYPNREHATRDANEIGNVLRTMIQTGEGIEPADVVGIDSVASLLPTEELEHDLTEGDARVASLARLMPLLLRMLTTMNDQTAFIWTNQWRDKISRIPGQKSTPGGRALGFFASTMVEMAVSSAETEEVEAIVKGKPQKGAKRKSGTWITCTATKEKTGARPFGVRSFLLDYNTKMPDSVRELIDLGLEDGILTYVGGRYRMDVAGYSVNAHGIQQMRKRLEEDDDLRGFLTACVTERTYELAHGEDDDGPAAA
jgi:RecA/RadA recombinase